MLSLPLQRSSWSQSGPQGSESSAVDVGDQVDASHGAEFVECVPGERNALCRSVSRPWFTGVVEGCELRAGGGLAYRGETGLMQQLLSGVEPIGIVEG